MAAIFITVKESAHSWEMDGYDELHPYHMSISHEKPTHVYYCLYGKHYAKQKRKIQNIIYYMVQLL